ncbi:nitroreductase [Futiania mangrovi]|uniref:Nitroreductase n=1 Tax=Futiania mangrovi TaxID=2959716 RepID=A0A9J6PJ98_9PROT|nr:nitroreductase [Futiania mangrovii]MCP1337888.1 nitroreductase [Futiania mangrovii]
MTQMPAATPEADTLSRLLDARYSCRGYRPDPVPEAVIRRILTMAQRTASWCNSQPWQVIVTRGAGTERFREALHAHASEHQGNPDFPHPREYRGVYLDRRRACGFQLYDAVGIARGDRAASRQQALQNFRLFGAPHIAIITTDEALGVYGAVDCGGYLATFLLAAQAMGIATIPQAAIASYPDLIRAHFGLGEDRRVVAGISFGYEDPNHPANAFRTVRASLDEAVNWADT